MKVKFKVKHGENEIDIPIEQYQKQRPLFDRGGMADLWARKITIYNDIPADAVNDRRFVRSVIDKCNVQGGIISKADGTIENVVNAITVITKDVDRYKSPSEYRRTPVDLATDCYTVQIGDFVVLSEVNDVITTSREFAELQKKYADNGFVVRTVSSYIEGMSVDNVQFANVG